MVTIEVTQDFIEQREHRLPLYNKKLDWDDKAAVTRARKRIECEIYEWHMVNTGQWSDTDDWKIDGICKENGNVDVKFIEKWFNIDQLKMLNIARQHDTIQHYRFMEWIERPTNVLVSGDVVTIRHIRDIPYTQLVNNIQQSRSGANRGYYVDVREITRTLV